MTILHDEQAFDYAYRNYMDKGGHSYDEWDIRMAWKHYNNDPGYYDFLFQDYLFD